jgi:hypothetical protein
LELISRVEKLEKPEKQPDEKEKAKEQELKRKLDEYIDPHKYHITEIHEWYRDYTEIRDWYMDHMDYYWKDTFVRRCLRCFASVPEQAAYCPSCGTRHTLPLGEIPDWFRKLTYSEDLHDITVEGKIVELGKPWRGENTWNQLAKLRDDTGEIAMQLSGDVVEDEDVSLGDTVRVEHGWVSDKHRGELTLYDTGRPPEDRGVIINPKDSVPFPTREWVEQSLKEIMKDSKYGQDSLKVLKLLAETKHPHKYRCHFDDLISKSGIYEPRMEKIINLLKHEFLVREVNWKGFYSIPYNLRAHLPELVMQYV